MTTKQVADGLGTTPNVITETGKWTVDSLSKYLYLTKDELTSILKKSFPNKNILGVFNLSDEEYSQIYSYVISNSKKLTPLIIGNILNVQSHFVEKILKLSDGYIGMDKNFEKSDENTWKNISILLSSYIAYNTVNINDKTMIDTLDYIGNDDISYGIDDIEYFLKILDNSVLYNKIIESCKNKNFIDDMYKKGLKDSYKGLDIIDVLLKNSINAFNAIGTLQHTLFPKEFNTPNYHFSTNATQYNKTSDDVGFVYIAKQLNESNIYKIGKSNDIQQRLNTFKCGNCFVEIVASKQCTSPLKVESYFHRYFSKKLYKGEWYKLDSNDIDDLIDVFGFNYHLTSENNK